jgi:DNA-binding transcriptional MerR regulator
MRFANAGEELASIRDVASRFALPISTLHYWERRGLVKPHWRSQRRYYDTDQVYRIALIRQFREIGLMSLEEISAILSGHLPEQNWRNTVQIRLAEIKDQQARLCTARDYPRFRARKMSAFSKVGRVSDRSQWTHRKKIIYRVDG